MKKIGSASAKTRKTAGALTRKKAPKSAAEFVVDMVYPCCGLKADNPRTCEAICGGRRAGVYLGTYHKFEASLLRDGKKGAAVLAAGCRRFNSPKEAKSHWRKGRNPRGEPRPYAAALIAKAIRVAKALGWKWAA